MIKKSSSTPLFLARCEPRARPQIQVDHDEDSLHGKIIRRLVRVRRCCCTNAISSGCYRSQRYHVRTSDSIVDRSDDWKVVCQVLRALVRTLQNAGSNLVSVPTIPFHNNPLRHVLTSYASLSLFAMNEGRSLTQRFRNTIQMTVLSLPK